MSTILRVALENATAATAIAIAVAVLALALRRWPALVHCLWLLVLLKLITPPLWKLPVAAPPAFSRLASAVAPAPANHALDWLKEVDDVDAVLSDPGVEGDLVEFSVTGVEPDAPPEDVRVDSQTHRLSGVLTALGWVWLLGSGASLALAVVRIRRFQHVLASAKPAGEPLCELVDEVAGRIGLGRLPSVQTVPGGVSPMVWSLGGTPVLILPLDLWKRLDPAQRETLIAHELAHLKRGDDRVRLIELAVSILYWWHPVVWWVRRALREAEEQSCDAWVVWAFPSASRTYAETLVDTVEFLGGVRSAVPVGASGFGHAHYLKRRLIMIMRGTTQRTLGWPGSLATLTLSMALLPFGPSWAQESDSKDKPQTLEQVYTVVASPVEEKVEVFTKVKPVEGRLLSVVMSDDVKAASSLDSIRDAISRLDAELKELKSADANDAQAAEKSAAIKRAIAELERVARPKADEANRARFRVQRVEGDNVTLDRLSRAAGADVLSRPVDEVLLKRARETLVDLGKLDRASQSDEVLLKRARETLASAGKDLTPEKAAELEKLKAEMAELHQLLNQKTERMQQASNELAEVRKKLADLARKVGETTGQPVKYEVRTIRVPSTTSATTVVRGVLQPANVTERRVDSMPPRATVGTAAAGAGAIPRNQEQEKRLSEVERKLDRILSELDSLKKDAPRDRPVR